MLGVSHKLLQVMQRGRSLTRQQRIIRSFERNICLRPDLRTINPLPTPIRHPTNATAEQTCDHSRSNTPEHWPEPQQSSASQSSAPTQQFRGVPHSRANTPESWPEPQQSSASQSSAPTQQFHGVPACTQQVNQPFMQQWYSPDRCVWWAWQPTQWGHTPTTSRTSFTSSSQHPYGGGSNCQHGDNEDANRAKN